MPTIFLLIAGALAPAFSNYLLYVATLACLFAMLAVSFDVLLGYTGYLSLTHGALFGVGAYCGAYLTARLGWSFWLALPISGLMAAAVGAFIALIAFRTRGLYFAVLTLAIGLVCHQVFLVWVPVTGGIGGFIGIPGIPTVPWLPESRSAQNFIITLAGLWATYIVAQFFIRSRFGAACKAVREDDVLAQALGVRIAVARLFAFVFSAFFAGVAGAMFAAISGFVAPQTFAVLTTGFQVVVLVVVGGMGTLWGPIIGAIFLTFLPESLRIASMYSLLVYGILLLAVIIFAPQGIAGLIKFGWEKIPMNVRLRQGPLPKGDETS